MEFEAKSNYNPFLNPEQNAQRGVVVAISEDGVRNEKLISVIPQSMAGAILSTETHTGETKPRPEMKTKLLNPKNNS